jgi:uncharacterized protein (DUF1015 family)
MAVVGPLHGVRYVAERVGNLRDVIAPPYDVISPTQQAALYDRSPWNVVRLVLARGAEPARAAATDLARWMREGVLARDPMRAVYLYEQTFALRDRTVHRRTGVLCRLRLEPFATGVVRPHEKTLSGPKAEQLALMRATGAQLSPIFGLYARPGERVVDVLGVPASVPAPVDVVGDGGERHRLWPVTDAAAIARLTAALASETIVIADGHHRYETALVYRDEHGGRPATVLAFLGNIAEEGIVILPTHRLVRGRMSLTAATLEERLRETFAVEPMLDGAPRPHGTIDVVLPDRRLRVRPLPSARAKLAAVPPAVAGLDVALLHRTLLEPVLGLRPTDLAFTHEDAEAVAAVASGEAGAAFLLNPPSLEEVRAVCMAGELMPEKSTYFYPKLASGLVFDLVGPPWI